MRGDNPKQRDPLVEDLGRAAQDLAAGDQNVKGRATTALKKVVRVFQQTDRVGHGQLSYCVGRGGPRIGGNSARARGESTGEIDSGSRQLGVLK